MKEVRQESRVKSESHGALSVKHPGKHLTKSGGFTLIELAIVLVIIGIILGAVLKGQDLMENARYKRLANHLKQFETLTWAFYDRKGKFPGDDDKDGKIDGDPKADITQNGKFSDPPTDNSINLGSYTFYVWLGNDGTKNILAITKDKDTPLDEFTDPELAYMEAIDTYIDGVADGTSGRVRGTTGIALDDDKWLASGTSDTSAAWNTSSGTKALIYYFDKK